MPLVYSNATVANTVKNVSGLSVRFFPCVYILMLIVIGSTSTRAGIDGSKHDLGGSLANDDGEVCVYCHTAHGADATESVPLWNRKLPPSNYTMYSTLNTVSLDGIEANVGSVSLACLSCHDGVTGRDVVLNAPGSGRYNAQGYSMGELGSLTGTPIPNLGTDLTDDHPISIQYAGGGCDDTAFCTTQLLGDKDFIVPQFATLNTKLVWWLDTYAGATGMREKTDLLLYSRDEFSSGIFEPFVECGSCHDPHEDTSRPVQFMRISNHNSLVCKACHVK